MASKVQIANMALSNLGADRIVSFDDNTVSAKEISAKYELIAEMVMAMGPWPSVKKRVELPRLEDVPSFGYSYQYQLPTNPKCLRVLEINECRLGDVDYQIEDGKLLTNEATVSILYLAKIEDSESYDIYLMQAIIAKLTASMAYKFTGQIAVPEKLIMAMDKEVNQLLNKAGGQGSGRRIPSDAFIDVRRGGGTNLTDDWNITG